MVKVGYITNQFFNSRTYILSTDSSDEVWLVDCGDVEQALERLAKGKRVKGVLLTHTHADHIYGINRLLELFPEATVFTNTFGQGALDDSRLNITRYHNEVPDLIISKRENVRVVGEGETIAVFEGVKAEVFYTQGHDASCLTYQVESYLFTGDSYIPGVPVVARFPQSNKKQAAASEARIQSLAEGLIVCPGHTI